MSYEGQDLEALFCLKNYQRWIITRFSPYLSGHTVEFGAGLGAFSQGLLSHVEHLDVVEPASNLVSELVERFADEPRITVLSRTIEEYVADCPSAARANVILINLLEHLSDDRGTMESLARIVRPGGHALIFVPALPALFSRLDSRLGHFRRYSAATLAAAVRGPEWRIVEQRYFDFLGIVPWWIVNTVCGKQSFDPHMARFYDRFGVPVTRSIETVIRPPLGKNLLLVAERRG